MFCVIHEELVYIFQIEDFGEIFATVITIEFKAFLMKNFYTHLQIAYSSKIFATLITIESFLSWTAVICPFNPILCVKFLPHSSHLYFLKSFMDIFHMYFKISLSNNFFFFGNFYSQMTNLKIHYKIVHEGQKKF